MAAWSCSPSSSACVQNSSTSGFELASPLSPLSPLSAAVVSVVSPESPLSSSELQAAAVPAKSRPTRMRPRNLRMEGDPSVMFSAAADRVTVPTVSRTAHRMS